MTALEHLPGRLFTDAYVGWMGKLDLHGDNSFSYVVGIVQIR